MEYGDKKLCQSITIARFLANEFGIAGKNNMEKAEADMIVDTIVDVQIGNQCHFYVFEIFYNKYIFLNYWKIWPKYCDCISELFKNMFEKNPIEKKKQADKLEKETLPRFLKQMLAIRQQSSGSFLVGNDVSLYQNKS